MIDFQNGSFVKLKPADMTTYWEQLAPLLVEGEHHVATFKAMRDGVVFTNKRVIAINVQGVTGKKIDYTTLPYSKIQAFSIETAGVFDMDSELEIWFSGMGKVKFDFTSRADVSGICRIISGYVL